MPPQTSPRSSLEEGAPLLPPIDGHHGGASASPTPTPAPVPKKHKPWIFLLVLIFLLVAIVDVGAFLAEAPKTRVYEANLCLHYYETHDPSKIGDGGSVPEKLCKIDEVQQKMATILGWQDMFDAIPAILLAVPFGALADKWGRKWILAGSLMGLQFNSAWILLICYFRSLPLQLTWFSSAFYFVGGGPIVAGAVGITMVSDIVPPVKRTTIFLYLTASVLVAELIAPIMAARLMERGNWYPLLLALAIQQVGICIAVFFPETLHLRDLPEHEDDDEQSFELQTQPHRHGFKAQLRHFKDALLLLKSDWTLALVVFTFLANRLGRQALNLLIRYASKRYHWEIKKAAYLLSFRAATNLVAITVFVPVVNVVLVKYLRRPTYWADLWIARGSIVLTTLSFFVMGVAAHPALLILGLLVYNLGTGYDAAMRSTAIHVVGGQSSPDIGKLMSLLAIMESIGSMFAGPLLNEMFQWGMDMGPAWLGLPFLGACFTFGCTTIITFIISVRDKNVGYAEVASEEEDEPEPSNGSSSAIEP